jgi:hypothetical protein
VKAAIPPLPGWTAFCAGRTLCGGRTLCAGRIFSVGGTLCAGVTWCVERPLCLGGALYVEGMLCVEGMSCVDGMPRFEGPLRALEALYAELMAPPVAPTLGPVAVLSSSFRYGPLVCWAGWLT